MSTKICLPCFKARLVLSSATWLWAGTKHGYSGRPVACILSAARFSPSRSGGAAVCVSIFDAPYFCRNVVQKTQNGPVVFENGGMFYMLEAFALLCLTLCRGFANEG